MSEENYAAESVPAVTPGTVLRKGREARRLSIDEVARALRLSVSQISAIEAGKLESLGGEVFVRGFIRNYARFVHIDPEFVLELLGPQSVLPVTQLRVPAQARVVMPTAGDRRLKALPVIAISVLALALIGGVGFYLGWFGEAQAPALSGSRQALTQEHATPPVVTQPVTNPAALDQTVNPPADAVTQPDTGVAGHRVVLRFQQEAWAEVRDADNRLLLSQKNPAGAVQVVAGKPPFKMIISNAAAVQLEYDGRNIDLQPHTRVDVARLTLE